MSDRIDANHGVTFNLGGQPPIQPSPPPARSWDSEPLREGLDQWRYARRVELVNLAIPFVVALVHGGDAALATDEAWREDPGAADGRVVERAVRLARMLQDAVDRARPRA